MNNNRKTNASTSTSSSNSTNPQSEIERLKAQIAALEAKNQSQGQEEVFEPDIDIPDSAQIKVINLFPGRLVLSTKKYGQGGQEYKFMNTGEVKKITYAHIRDILEVHSNFLQNGVFAILDKRVIHNHGLDDVYSKILTKEKIDVILAGKNEDAILFYQSANDSQKQLIVTMIIDKLRDDPDSMEYSIVDRLSRVAGIKLAERAEEAREYLDAINEDNKEKIGV